VDLTINIATCKKTVEDYTFVSVTATYKSTRTYCGFNPRAVLVFRLGLWLNYFFSARSAEASGSESKRVVKPVGTHGCQHLLLDKVTYTLI